MAAAHKRNTELDDLERELGLDVLDDALAAATRGDSTDGPIESALPARDRDRDRDREGHHGGHLGASGRSTALHSRSNSGASLLSVSGHGVGGTVSGRGCLPSHWILGIFSGSLPPAQAAWLLDWAILSDNQYAGELPALFIQCLCGAVFRVFKWSFETVVFYFNQ
jgi:hypothetical protein